MQPLTTTLDTLIDMLVGTHVMKRHLLLHCVFYFALEKRQNALRTQMCASSSVNRNCSIVIRMSFTKKTASTSIKRLTQIYNRGGGKLVQGCRMTYK